ncbi:MAG: hypothetical protein KA105_02485 [Caulobacter sp.]|nr:hypothetical protein [Caulobacter sp.]
MTQPSLVERLRSNAAETAQTWSDQLMLEAAQAIERLEGELSELRVDLHAATVVESNLEHDKDRLRSKLSELEGELARWSDAYKIAHDQATENGAALNVTRSKLDEAVGALETSEGWLERWAQHVGSCPGAARCTCGLTRARWEAVSTLQKIRGQA